MDAHRFDALTRTLSNGSRRGLLGTLLSMPLVGGLLALLGVDDTTAKGRRKRRKKRHKHGKDNGRHRKGKRKQKKCKAKSRAKICAGKCGIVKNRKTCQKKVNCGPCVACSATQPCPSGCCAGDETCQPGTTSQACGADGGTCQVCTDAQFCQDGACQPCDVCAASGCQFTSIQDAINLASVGAIIQLCPEVYQELATIVIDRPVTLRGAGQGENGTVLDGQEQRRVVEVADGVQDVFLEDLRIIGGDSAFGGGLLNNGAVTLTDCTVSGNTADNAAGILSGIGSEMALIDSTVSGNVAVESGGGLTNNGILTITGSTVSGNTATNLAGGGILNNPVGTLTLTDSTVIGNTAGDLGGGIANTAGMVTLEAGSRVSGNTAVVGGGIHNDVGTVEVQPGAFVCDNSTPQCASLSAPIANCPFPTDGECPG